MGREQGSLQNFKKVFSMKKSYIATFTIVFVSLVLVLSFQNCGGDLGLIDNLKTQSTLAPSEPLELSSDVTQMQMRLNSSDEVLLPEENINVDLNLESQNLQLTDSQASEQFLLSNSEVQEIRVLLRLIRKISLSERRCKEMVTRVDYPSLSEMDELRPEPIIVNTNDERNIILGEYVNCKAKYDLAKQERRMLKRMILRIILSRTQVHCPTSGLVDPPVCSEGSYLVKKVSKNYCDNGYKCVEQPKQCLNNNLIIAPRCPASSSLVKVFEGGCLVGYKCESSHHMCPLLPQIAIKCAPGYFPVEQYDENKCATGLKCQKPLECPARLINGDLANLCKSNGGKYLPIKNEVGCTIDHKCDISFNCPINVRSNYNPNEARECLAASGKYLPIKNKNQCIVGYNCIGQCRKYHERRPAGWEEECEKSGGKVIPPLAKNGCIQPSKCERPNNCPIPFVPHYNPDKDKECRASGGEYRPIRENNCTIGYDCLKKSCPDLLPLPPDYRKECEVSGGVLVYPKTINGCTVPPICNRPKKCTKVMPVVSESLIKRCKVLGGKLKLERNEDGCPLRYVCEGSKEPCLTPEPSFNLIKECKDKGGNLEPIKGDNQCAVGYRCKQTNFECPATTHVQRVCKAGERLVTQTNENGCIIGHKCLPDYDGPTACIATPVPYPSCTDGKKAVEKVDQNGCVTDYKCETDSWNCPELLALPPFCDNGMSYVKGEDGCVTGYKCNEPVNCLLLSPPAPGFCGDEQIVSSVKDKRGCTVSYECKERNAVCKAEIQIKPDCGVNAYAELNKSYNGCFAGWTCKPKLDIPHFCPIMTQAMPICKPPSKSKVISDSNGCRIGFKCVNSENVGGVTTIPKNCQTWFDGCNNCTVENGKLLGCTKKACFVREPSQCVSYK